MTLRGSTRRSRLAGEEVLESCSALGDAFAGKPAPTQVSACTGQPLSRRSGAGTGSPAGRLRAGSAG
ncbi:hypothetical protein DMX08_04250 [Pseudomonas protegens]|uniref:Uncharacterized protein n=1 Tax=Pseudomonas protegens TaxID=380021 RepID=A0A9Q6NBE3_9PSED|nr:hypothetical protein DMX08_04250 [Pseudomonas protegens]